jgi:hypothetical protein
MGMNLFAANLLAKIHFQDLPTLKLNVSLFGFIKALSLNGFNGVREGSEWLF